jgi:hypothetical protein
MTNGAVPEDNRKLLQWVISLAVSIVCCAVLFLVFASFLLDNQRSLMKLELQQEIIQTKLSAVDSNINYMMRLAKDSKQLDTTVTVPSVTTTGETVSTPAVTMPAIVPVPAVPVAPAPSAPVQP